MKVQPISKTNFYSEDFIKDESKSIEITEEQYEKILIGELQFNSKLSGVIKNKEYIKAEILYNVIKQINEHKEWFEYYDRKIIQMQAYMRKKWVCLDGTKPETMIEKLDNERDYHESEIRRLEKLL